MAQIEKETQQTAAAEGPTLPELIRYDGPPELAAAWHAFTRQFAAAGNRKQQQPKLYRSRIEQANLLNELAFGQNGVAGFLERRGIPGSRTQLELPAIPPETGLTHTIHVRALHNEAQRRALDRVKKDIEEVALALGEATGNDAEGYAEAREVLNCISARLMEQWIAREKAVGLYPPRKRTGDITKAERLRRQALLADVEGEALSGTLYSLHAPIMIKYGNELLWHKLSAAQKARFNQDDVTGDALLQFNNALFSYDAGYNTLFTTHAIGAVQLLAAKGYHPVRSKAQRAKEKRTRSLDHAFEDNESGWGTTEAQVVADPFAEQPEDQAARRERDERVRQALAELPQRERTVLSLRFGLDGQEPMTLEEVGQFFGISKERIRQLQARALEQLRDNPACAVLFAELEGLADEEQAALSDSSSSGREAPPSMLDKLAANGRKRSQMTL